MFLIKHLCQHVSLRALLLFLASIKRRWLLACSYPVPSYIRRRPVMLAGFVYLYNNIRKLQQQQQGGQVDDAACQPSVCRQLIIR